MRLSLPWFLPLAALPVLGAPLDLRNAAVVVPDGLPGPARKAVVMLVEEVEARTLVRWPVQSAPPPGGSPCIAIAISTAPSLPAEGYRIQSRAAGQGCAVTITGNDARGVLFGVGRLLRELRMGRETVTLRDSWDLTTAPRLPVRGHQLGYRNINNTYDAWTVADYERYIRDMAVFGANTIEIIAGGDSASASPHFPVHPRRMNQEISRLAQDYGLAVSLFLPATQKSYEDPDTIERELKRWDAVFRSLPQVDAVFVPGGDPGHTEPRILMPFLEKATAVLHKAHPKAGMWVSPQAMDDTWMNQFYTALRSNPSWLAGVVHGPWVRVPMKDFRAAVPAGIPIRLYPDVTHTLRCQFPLLDWDPAFAVTYGREPINPMPLWEADLFRSYFPGSNGFVTYSDGANDDVNKVVWTALGWDPDADPVAILRDYARYFTGASEVADGLLALERNWRGPLASNAEVETTLAQFRALERGASPRLLRNWRFQQALYRAYYDAYTQRRLRYEISLETEARNHLSRAAETGSVAAMDAAAQVLLKAVSRHTAPELRSRVFELAEALFQSIGTQLSVERYGGSGWERGVTLDTVDAPLNNRPWLLARFAEIRGLSDEKARLEAIREILHWDDPGPGGFYDDLGNPSRQPHLILDGEPGQQGFWEVLSGPLSWKSHASSWRGRPIRLRYTGLDPDAEYKVRVVYGGENVVQEQKIRLVANGDIVVHPYMPKPLPIRPVEFDIPSVATRSGELTLSWDREEPPSGRLRGAQVSEVWLIRKR